MVSAADSVGLVALVSLLGIGHSFVPLLHHHHHHRHPVLDAGDRSSSKGKGNSKSQRDQGRCFMVAESPPLFGTYEYMR